VLDCSGYDPQAPAEVPEISEVLIVNKCPAGVKVKVGRAGRGGVRLKG